MRLWGEQSSALKVWDASIHVKVRVCEQAFVYAPPLVAWLGSVLSIYSVTLGQLESGMVVYQETPRPLSHSLC